MWPSLLLGQGAPDGGRVAPVVMEPVDDGAGLQVELSGELLDGFGGWVWLLLIGSFQGFFLLGCQHHSGFLQLVLWLWAGALAIVDAHRWGLTGLAVADRAVPPLHVGCGGERAG